MATRTILLTGLRMLATCLLFAVCFAVGGALSGLDKISQQRSRPSPPANQQIPQMPEHVQEDEANSLTHPHYPLQFRH